MDIVADGSMPNLEGMTFIEFMGKLDRIVEKNEKEAEAAKKRAKELKPKRHG